MQAAFWSYHVTIVGILKPSSCLASTDTCLLLSSSSLVDIHFGFYDTIVSCFSSSRPHSSLVTAFFCLPPTICPCVLCPLLSRGDPGGRAHILSNSILSLGPHIPWIYISHWAASRAASLPVLPFLVSIQVDHPPRHPGQKPGTCPRFLSSPPCVSFKIIPPGSHLLSAVGPWVLLLGHLDCVPCLRCYQNSHSKMQI